MLPVLIGIAPIAALSYYLIRKGFKQYLKGKDVIILGPMKSGKTMANNYLRNIVTKKVNATKEKEDVKGNEFSVGGLDLVIRQGYDVAGLKERRDTWKPLFINSDLCFYIYDCSRIYHEDEDYVHRVKNDLLRLKEWIDESGQSKKELILIGSHLDVLISEKVKLEKIEKSILTTLKKDYLKLNIGSSSLFLGSLIDDKKLEQLFTKILKYLKNK